MTPNKPSTAISVLSAWTSGRLNVGLIAGLIASLIAFSPSATAQRDYSKVQIKPTQLTETTYMLQGAGGNIGVLLGQNGIVLVDGQHPALTKKIQAALKALSDKPVTHVINTHWHHDHTGGNENFHRAGAEIVAHENVRERLSSEQTLRAWNMKFPAMPNAALPTRTHTKGMTLSQAGEDITIMHPPNAHTDGDSIVYFPKANVLHMGDIYTPGRFPYIDRNAKGSLTGAIKAVDSAIEMTNENTKVIPGHGNVTSQQALKTFAAMLKQAHSKIAPLIAKGKTRAEIIAAKPLATLEKQWGQTWMTADLFAEIVFDVETAR